MGLGTGQGLPPQTERAGEKRTIEKGPLKLLRAWWDEIDAPYLNLHGT